VQDFYDSGDRGKNTAEEQTQFLKPAVSIIIPCLNEEKYIGTILANILEQDYPLELIEVLVVDGMSTDKTRSEVKSFRNKFSLINLIDNEKRFVPFALNLGIKKSTGDVIMIFGSHATYPSDYVSILVRSLYELKADNVGALVETRPPDGTLKARAIAEAISCPFGVGNAYFRTGAETRIQVDTVPFGCYPRAIFDKIGLFDEELIRNQDDEFNARLIRNGGKIWLIPEISLVYYSRSKISELLRMYYQYGFFKPLVLKKNRKPATLRQLVPSGFLLFLLCGLPAAILDFPFSLFYLAVICLYGITDLYFSLKICFTRKLPGLFLYLPWLFLLLHFSYGAGYLAGIFYFILFKKKKYSIRTSR
jgi:glycosyltransferase involved in cell wall biosynthesis